jgi:hypothetical protein
MTDPDPDQAQDRVVRRAEASAAAAARLIGNGGRRVSDNHQDPAMIPVIEAGGGVAEGFEEAEELLRENAEHGDGNGAPLLDAFTPEVESDLVGLEYGQADEEKSTETRD